MLREGYTCLKREPHDCDTPRTHRLLRRLEPLMMRGWQANAHEMKRRLALMPGDTRAQMEVWVWLQRN